MEKKIRLSAELYTLLPPVVWKSFYGVTLCAKHRTPFAIRSFDLRFVYGPGITFAGKVITAIEIVYCPVCHKDASPLFTASALERCIKDGLRRGLVCAVETTAYFYLSPPFEEGSAEENR